MAQCDQNTWTLGTQVVINPCESGLMSTFSGWASIMDGWLLVGLMNYVMYFVLFATLILGFD